MKLRDRGVRKKNLHVLRETRMPAVLIEGGFMDSRTDISALRNSDRLQAQGDAIAEAIIECFQLNKKITTTAPSTAQPTTTNLKYRLVTGTFPSKSIATKAAERLKKNYGWTVYVKEEM